VHTETLRRIGPFDTGILTIFHDTDFALEMQKIGGTMYVEPASVVAYLAPPPFELSDVPYYLLHLSNAWLKPTVEHFARKYGLPVDDPGLRVHTWWVRPHRRTLIQPLLSRIEGRYGTRAGAFAKRLVDELVFNGVVEGSLVRRLENHRARGMINGCVA
jgi:GT2 family glycosyltransferase